MAAPLPAPSPPRLTGSAPRLPVLGGRFFINFVRQLNRMLDPGTLVNLLPGRYHRPVAEARIFMFLDLNDSTAIAELRGKVEALRVDGRRR
jgi:hypothetical protein